MPSRTASNPTGPVDVRRPAHPCDERPELVVRQVHEHDLPTRAQRATAHPLPGLGGNTALTVGLAEIAPGGERCGHRHFDETLTYVLAGCGHSAFRQDERRRLTRVDWSAGDLMATPANAWHQHVNDDPTRAARLLVFSNPAVVARLIGHDVDQRLWRMYDRYDDEPDYFSAVHTEPDGSRRAAFVRQVACTPLPADAAALGHGVAQQRYVMGGHRMLCTRVVRVRPGGDVAAHRVTAEEVLLVLEGSGRTDVWVADRPPVVSIPWRAGDLLAPPMDTWRRHVNTGGSDARFLVVRNVFALRGLSDALAAADRPDQRLPAGIDHRI